MDMEKCRGVYRDADLGVEITWFRGLSLSFPAHFHDCYVIGVTDRGVRRMRCGAAGGLFRPEPFHQTVCAASRRFARRVPGHFFQGGQRMTSKTRSGHLAALVTVLIWGTTFVSTKVLLAAFSPIEILVLRFVLGYLALWAVCPRVLRGVPRRQELYFAAAGLCGVCLYYLLENIALTYTTASNVGVIVSMSPCFTALLARLAFRDQPRLRPSFFAGFALAMAGICLISFAGSGAALDPIGDVLALLAAVSWAFYSVLTRKLGTFGYGDIQVTRRVFFYGLLWMAPAMAVLGFSPDRAALARPELLANLLYLGLGASALCFVTWGVAVGRLGAVKTSVYIYLVPVITVAASALVLHETLTPSAWLGIALTLSGLAVSQEKSA